MDWDTSVLEFYQTAVQAKAGDVCRLSSLQGAEAGETKREENTKQTEEARLHEHTTRA